MAASSSEVAARDTGSVRRGRCPVGVPAEQEVVLQQVGERLPLPCAGVFHQPPRTRLNPVR
jgi:hypothetical protein